MLSAVLKNKKMVMNVKKRKSNESEPKASFAKKVKPTVESAVKKVPPKSTKVQTPKTAKVKKAIKAPISTSPKSKVSPKKKGKQNGVVKKQTPVKNIKKSNKQKTPLPKIEKTIESPEESDEAETSDNEEDTSLVEHDPKTADNKIEKTSKQGGRRSGMLHKLADLKKKVGEGDKTAIKQVQDIIKKLEERSDLSKTAKRKLGAYKKMLVKGKLEEAASKPKGKKVIKKKK